MGAEMKIRLAGIIIEIAGGKRREAARIYNIGRICARAGSSILSCASERFAGFARACTGSVCNFSSSLQR